MVFLKNIKVEYLNAFIVDKGHSKEIGGTGLGLAIVKHICEIYQYELKLESTIGKGTKITIKFE